MPSKPRAALPKTVDGVLKEAARVRIRRPTPELEDMLRAVYEEWNYRPNREMREEFVFHMTDWLGDLIDVGRLYRRPGSCSKKAAGQIVFGLFIHALNHIKAAARIFLGEDCPDPFESLYRELDAGVKVKHPDPKASSRRAGSGGRRR